MLATNRYIGVLPAFFALGACLASESDVPQLCETSSDCRVSQVCDEGVCWGDPPAINRFAAILIPPASRPDLAPNELRTIEISPDGTMYGLEFLSNITVHGKIALAGSSLPISAQIVIEREAAFMGGPKYQRRVITNIQASAEEDSFSVRLPKDNAQYSVTVFPIAQDDKIAALEIPPLFLTIDSTADREVLWELGRPEDFKTLSGCIENSIGNGDGYQGMLVTALGRTSPSAQPTRVSGIVTADSDGCFDLQVPIAMEDTFDIVVKPAPGVPLPTLKLSGEVVPDSEGIHTIAPLIMPNAANPVQFKLPIVGLTSGGAKQPIAGANVTIETTFVSENPRVTIFHSEQAVSNARTENEPGVATLNLYPGSFEKNRTYTVRVISPPDSEHASLFNANVIVGSGEGAPVLDNVQLERRVAVRGTVLRADGTPLFNSPVQVHPAAVLRNTLTDPGDQSILDNLQFPSALTGESGDFLLWLDRELLDIKASYDLELSPPDFSEAPRWTFQNVVIEDKTTNSMDFGALQLPAASYSRGLVLDPAGIPVAGAELRWYQIPLSHAPARLLGIWESDSQGQVIAVLPDP